jgi:putative glycosyltransferase (TIGR04348 family)
MRIGIITPAPPRSKFGNRVTAVRWARILRKLGHRVSVKQEYDGRRYDLLIALHARKSHEAVRQFHQQHPESPTIVALTGTDLYHDLRTSPSARASLELATRIVALQPKALDELEPGLSEKAVAIYQSVESRPHARRAAHSSLESRRSFDVCVIGHLRPVKDPFRAAMAARLLPASSRIRILQIGSAMTKAMARRARAESKRNRRYRWLGEQPRWRVRRILARGQLTVVSSRMEGGANVLSESLVASVPVLASRIPGNVGVLREDYPGYFTVGDTRGLARLLKRAENDAAFYAYLRTRCRKLARLFDPAREEQAWANLLDEIVRGRTHKHFGLEPENAGDLARVDVLSI